MTEEERNGGATPPLEPRRHELLAEVVGENNMPAAAVYTHKKILQGPLKYFLPSRAENEGRKYFEGEIFQKKFHDSREFFFQPPPAPSDGGARSSAG